jgi:cytochrome c556
MDPLMESFNGLNVNLRRTVRRSSDPEEDSIDATTGAILSLVMKADTSYVSDDDVAVWQKLSDEQAAAYRAVAAAMKKGDTDTARDQYKAVTQVCTACHDKFRD